MVHERSEDQLVADKEMYRMFPFLLPLSLQTSRAALLSNHMLGDILAGERLQPVILTDIKSCWCVKDGVQALIAV